MYRCLKLSHGRLGKRIRKVGEEIAFLAPHVALEKIGERRECVVERGLARCALDSCAQGLELPVLPHQTIQQARLDAAVLAGVGGVTGPGGAGLCSRNASASAVR